MIGTASPPTIAANIALNYKEATPERQSLLIATGLVLFVVTFLVNFAARWIAGRSAAEVGRDDQPPTDARSPTPRLPAWAPVLVGVDGAGRWPACRRCCRLEPRAVAASLAVVVFLVALPALVAPGRGPARGRRPVRHRR